MPRAAARLTPAVLVLALCTGRDAAAQADGSVELVVPAGRPLRVALASTSTVRRVGQTVDATLLEPVYAYDRVVLPAGTHVTGRVARLENPGKWSRARAWMSGDISPHRTIVLEFDSIDRSGEPMAIQTVVTNGVGRVKRQVAHDSTEQQQDEEKDGVVARAKQRAKETAEGAVESAKQKANDAIAAVKEPGRLERLKVWAIDHAPYHPQFLRQGTVYDAELRAPLSFGTTPAHPPAPEGSMPAPSSVLSARLSTTVDSAKSPRGTPLEAVVTEPVFAEDGRLIFPEGTKLIGEVTFARPARRLHRNGQLRFLFERVEAPDQESAPMLASLHAVDASDDDRVVLDDEGGVAVANSKARFVEPALAILALRASADQGEGRGFERGAVGTDVRSTSASVARRNPLARGLGGFIGFGMLGAGLSQISRPVGIAFAAYGAARSVYANILGKGQDVRFQADTPIQIRLAPGPSTSQ